MCHPTSSKQTIAIIGAGYSGTMIAVNILRTHPTCNLRVVLVEREQIPGRGLAYRFGDDNLLLNVPAGNMSALADDADSFVCYCQDIDPAFNSRSFISRRIYGEYLEYCLAEAEENHPGILERLTGEAVAIIPNATRTGYRIELAGGSCLEAQQVVLALGHFPPEPPPSVPENLHKYLVNPWDFSTIDSLDPNQPLAIMGAGHTAIDALFRLTSCNRSRKIFLLSRRGLLPHSHRFNPQPPSPSCYPDYLTGIPPTIRAYTRALRLEVERREASGGNWRDVVNELRPHTPRLWQSLPENEKRRFLQGLAPFWDTHRHRLAPSAARRLAGLLNSGQVERIAGHIESFGMQEASLAIRIRQRRDGQVRNLKVSAAVNCTGPNYDLSKLSQPLPTQLLKAGLIQQDPLKLGLLVDEEYQVIGIDNQPVPGLFYVGPMLRARYWEATAVPELRSHAYRLARRLMFAKD